MKRKMKGYLGLDVPITLGFDPMGVSGRALRKRSSHSVPLTRVTEQRNVTFTDIV